jgi:hypothetical protein
MKVNPAIQGRLHIVCGITPNALPVAGVRDIHLKQCLRQARSGMLACVKVVLKWNPVEAWNDQVSSASHQARGGSHPGGGASGVALGARRSASTARERIRTVC